MFDPEFPLKKLKPAEYNPRRIDAEDAEALDASLSRHGCLRPVIATTEGTIIAGHQRTARMRGLGWTHCPSFLLKPVGVTDEIRFNQLHNAADVATPGEFEVRVPAWSAAQWVMVPPGCVQVSGTPTHAYRRDEILRLISLHGPWSNAVATESGRVLVGHLYASATEILGQNLLVRYVPDASADAVVEDFSRSYGTFSYDHLPKTTWVQSMAQMFRLRGQASGGVSRLYERFVIPHLKPGMRLLDFGCGQGDYVKSLSKAGYDARGVEFYRRMPGKLAIDVTTVKRDVGLLVKSLEKDGPFDVVVLDSVLNSVDSVEAERAVLGTAYALCRPGGKVFWSGRSLERQRVTESHCRKKLDPTRMGLLFLDRSNFSAIFRGDAGWLYQHFHWQEDVEALAKDWFGPEYHFRRLDDSWFCVSTRAADHLPPKLVGECVRFEFSLPLPKGKRYDLADPVLSALGL